MSFVTAPEQQRPAAVPWSGRVFAVLAGAALLGILPLLIKGNVAAHDLQFHVSSWNEVAQQWRHGIFWPRWAAMANYGLGEPRFIFYPPISWLLGGALALWLPVRMLPGAFSFIAFFAAGAGMFTLARRYLPARLAIAAAVLYALNPYHLITVYWDFRVAEMLASAVFPVAVMFALDCSEDLRAAAGLALAVASVWLMNAPAGVMLMYTLALLLLVIAISTRSFRPVLYGAGGIALGIGLAAFYLVPAAYEQSWVNIYGIFGSGLTPRENFLFSVATDPPHTYFSFLVSGIALEQIALFAFSLPFAWRTRKDFSRLLLSAITATGIASAIMMFRFSSLLWALPKMQFIQFPWRWLLVLNLALCFAAMLALTRARTKWAWALLIVVFFAQTERDVIRQATWGKRSFSEMFWSVSPHGYRGTKEYLPHEVHVPPTPYLLPNAPLAELSCEIPCAPDPLTILRWSEEEKKMQVAAAVPASLTLKLYEYPAWQVRLDGNPVQHDVTYKGQIKVQVPPGRHDIDVRFTRTPDRTIGIVISALSALALFIFTFTSSRRTQQPASNRRPEQAISS
jgi:hypothetical protein